MYSTSPTPAGPNEIKGENTGDKIGGAVGSLAGTATGAAVGGATGVAGGTAVGLAKGAKGGFKSALKKGGKFGALAGLAGTVAGGVLGNKAGTEAGRYTGVKLGGAVGSMKDKPEDRSYSVSKITKSVYAAAKKVTPKSKKMKLARKAVETDKKVKGAAFELAANPGGVVKKGIEYGSKHPSTGLLWAAGNTAAPALPGITAGSIAIGSKIDKVGRKSLPGLYKAIEHAGMKLAPVASNVTNSAYNLARNFSKK